MKFSPTFYKNPSGSIGKLTASKTQGGAAFKARTKSRIKQTHKTSQTNVWLREANEIWRNATPRQRRNWDRYALVIRPLGQEHNPYPNLPRFLTIGHYQPTYIYRDGREIINPWGRYGVAYNLWVFRHREKKLEVFPEPPRPLSGLNAFTRGYIISRAAGRSGNRLIKFKRLFKKQQTQELPRVELEVAEDGLINARLRYTRNYYLKTIIYVGENTPLTINNYKSSYRRPHTRTINRAEAHNYLRLPRGIRHWCKFIRTSSKAQFPEATHCYFDTEPPEGYTSWYSSLGVIRGGKIRKPIINPRIPIIPPEPMPDGMMEMMEEMNNNPMTEPDPLSAEQWSEWRAQNCIETRNGLSICTTMPPTDNQDRVAAFGPGWLCR